MAISRIHFFSDALGQCVTCDVLLPQRADHAPDQKLPVLWLLHGAYGNHFDWLRRTGIERYVVPHTLAVVMPSARNSAYVDMAHGGRFHTYIADELPRFMRDTFNFSDKREDNFIAGLSMGGEGAMKIGLAHPHRYAAIGCLSAGAVNAVVPANLDPLRREMLYGGKLIEETPYDPYGNAREIVAAGGPFPRVYHACGSEDFLLDAAHKTRDFFTAIPGNPFDYTYEEGPGAHTWDFWDAYIERFIRYLALPPKAEGWR